MDAEQFAKLLEMQTKMFAQLLQNQDKSTSRAPEPAGGNQQINTALLPNFEQFCPEKEPFGNYKQRFENYLQMKNVFTDKVYCAKLLLNSIGAAHFNIITALAAPEQAGELTYDKLITLLNVHLHPKKNVLVAQHQFLCKYQTQQQTISDFVAALKSGMDECEFKCECQKSIAHVFLRAQFIRGIKDNSIREQLLQSEVSKFEDIVAKAVALEACRIDSKIIGQPTAMTVSPTMDINQITKSKHQGEHVHRSKSQRRDNQYQHKKGRSHSRINYSMLGIDGLCLRCGRSNHLSKECRSNKQNLKCASCNKSGHVSKVCIRTLLDHNSKKQSSESTNNVNSSYGIHNIVDIYHNQPPTDNMQRYYATVNIEGGKVAFEVDSGSGYTFLPRDMFGKLKIRRQLQPTAIAFRSYTQDVFVPDGKVKVHVEYKGKAMFEEVYIVPEEYPPLLGRTWIRQLDISLNEIDQQTSTEIFAVDNQIEHEDAIMKEYQEIFQESIGCVPGFAVTLKLREMSKPVFYRERELPYSLRSRVEQELDSLEQAGIITKVDTSDWGSPLVVIPKADGGVRLCVDYKMGE